MAETHRFGLVDFLVFILVVALAAGARAGYLVTCCDSGRTAGPLVVQDPRPQLPGPDHKTDLQELVERIRDDYAFSSQAPLSDGVEATAHTAPAYPWLLGLTARFVDRASFDSTIRWAQCGLGALTAGLYFLFALRAFRSLFVATLTGV